MKQISRTDLQSLFASLEELTSDLSITTLPQRTLKTVGSLISNEVISFDGFSSGNNYNFTVWTNQEDLLTQEVIDIFAMFAYQNPLIPIVIGEKRKVAVKITDCVTQSDFEKTELYNEFYKKIGNDYQIGIALPIASDLTISCGVNRAKKDFSERDRQILTLIAPHLINAIRNAFTFEHLNSALKKESCGVIAIDSARKVQFKSEFAEQLLEKYFSSETHESNSLPENLWSWLRHQTSLNTNEFDMPPQPFKIKNTVGELTIRLINNNTTRELTLLLEEEKYLSCKVLEQLNLTKREAEVLFWIARGKNDTEIGELLFISPRTVHKHTEHIYVKLGVETRISAVLRAMEILKIV
jgi:DNA-binding CsgD family transcriptional regulator